MNSLFAFLITILFCAIPLSAMAKPFDLLYDAIQSNDTEKTLQILKDNNQVLQPRMTGLFNKKDENKYFRIEILKSALEKMKDKRKCNPEVITALIKAGAITSEKALSSAAILPCSSDVIELMMSQIPESELALSIKLFFDHLSSNFANIFNRSEEEATTDTTLINYLSTMNTFKKLVEIKCTNDKETSVFCESKKSYEKFKSIGQSFVKQMESDEIQAKKDDAYNSSPVGIKAQACSLFLEIQENQEKINREKKIEKTSGVVNQSALHKAGSNIVDLTEQLNPLKKEYKKITNKYIDFKSCD